MHAGGIGRRLAEKRLERNERKGVVKKSQQNIADEVGISQTWVSLFENGHKDLDVADWRPEKLYDLFLAYGLSPSEMLEWSQEYHLERFHRYLTDRTRMYSVDEGRKKVRVAGTIGAGRLGESWAEEEVAYRTCPDHIASKYRLEDIIAVEVSGDSMIADSARDHIPPGSVVYLHMRLTPEAGEIVCVYLPSQDHTVLKRYEQDGTYTVLRSHNDQHQPIILDRKANAVLQGVYLAHEVLGPRFRQ